MSQATGACKINLVLYRRIKVMFKIQCYSEGRGLVRSGDILKIRTFASGHCTSKCINRQKYLLVLRFIIGTRLCLKFSVVCTRADAVWSEAPKFLKRELPPPDAVSQSAWNRLKIASWSFALIKVCGRVWNLLFLSLIHI